MYPFGNDIIAAHATDFGADIVITLIDIWTLRPDLGTLVRWCPWAPIDSLPIPDEVLLRARRAYRFLAYSQFAYSELKKVGIEVTYIPHGVNLKIFRPLSKREARLRFELPQDAFVVGMVAANQDFPPRKCFPRAFEAFARFREAHREALLYVHSWIGPERGGPDLLRLAKLFGIEDSCFFTQQYRYHLGLSSEEMAWLYNCFDVLLLCSRAEGFGLPLIEAQACGVPVISTNFSAMPELTASGWLIRPATTLINWLYSFQVLPDIDDIARKLELAYQMDREREREKALALARAYDYDVVVDAYWKPFFLEVEGEIENARSRIYCSSKIIAANSRGGITDGSS